MIVVHNRDWLENFQLFNRMNAKSSLPGFKFIYKILQTFPDLKTDQEELKQGKLLKVIFEILKIPAILHLLLFLVSHV